MTVAKTDLKFYLTTNVAGISQLDFSQSTGGYTSITEIALRSVISSVLTINDISQVSPIVFNGFTLVGDELVEVDDEVITGRGKLSTVAKPHFTNSLAIAAPSDNLFNNSFSQDSQQYRCISIKNVNTVDTFHNVGVYLKYNSINPYTGLSLGVEIPSTPSFTGTASEGNTLALTDETIENIYSDNYFLNCALVFMSGNNINLVRTIISYDGATGTFVFDTVLPFAVASGDTFTVDPHPAQRLSTGITPPEIDFTLANGRENAIDCGLLAPGNIVYLWIRRTITQNIDEYINNRVVITIKYTTV